MCAWTRAAQGGWFAGITCIQPRHRRDQFSIRQMAFLGAFGGGADFRRQRRRSKIIRYELEYMARAAMDPLLRRLSSVLALDVAP